MLARPVRARGTGDRAKLPIAPMWRSRSWPGGGAATARKGEGRLGAEPVLEDKGGPASAGEAQPAHGPPEAGRCAVGARSTQRRREHGGSEFPPKGCPPPSQRLCTEIQGEQGGPWARRVGHLPGPQFEGGRSEASTRERTEGDPGSSETPWLCRPTRNGQRPSTKPAERGPRDSRRGLREAAAQVTRQTQTGQRS